jgi:hypothetical protein
MSEVTRILVNERTGEAWIDTSEVDLFEDFDGLLGS